MMKNAGLDEAQAETKIARRNISNLRCADDTTFMVESKKKLTNHQKSKKVPGKHLYAKAFDCVDHNKLWKILKEMGIPDHLTCLLRHLYAGQEATVRTGHGTTDWFQTGKGVRQGCILSPCLFNIYTSCEMLGWLKHRLGSR